MNRDRTGYLQESSGVGLSLLDSRTAYGTEPAPHRSHQPENAENHEYFAYDGDVASQVELDEPYNEINLTARPPLANISEMSPNLAGMFDELVGRVILPRRINYLDVHDAFAGNSTRLDSKVAAAEIFIFKVKADGRHEKPTYAVMGYSSMDAIHRGEAPYGDFILLSEGDNLPVGREGWMPNLGTEFSTDEIAANPGLQDLYGVVGRRQGDICVSEGQVIVRDTSVRGSSMEVEFNANSGEVWADRDAARKEDERLRRKPRYHSDVSATALKTQPPGEVGAQDREAQDLLAEVAQQAMARLAVQEEIEKALAAEPTVERPAPVPQVKERHPVSPVKRAGRSMRSLLALTRGKDHTSRSRNDVRSHRAA